MSSPISGFTAIPNPQMLAFMPIQSYLMMYFAGSGWQYGKRKISAMSNEQFNKLTPEELLKQHSIELKNMLPTLKQALQDVSPLIETLIVQYGDFVKRAIEAVPKATAQILETDPSAVTGLAGPVYQYQSETLTAVAKGILAFLTGDYSSIEAEARRGDPNIKTTPIPQIFKLPPTTIGHDMTQPHHQVPVSVLKTPIQATAPVQGGKKAAGQSQIYERNRLIQIIAEQGALLKNAYIGVNKHPLGSSKRAAAQSVANGIATYMQARQQELVNLLDRYKF